MVDVRMAGCALVANGREALSCQPGVMECRTGAPCPDPATLAGP